MLIALLVLSLVSVLCTRMLWQQDRHMQAEQAMREHQQARWLLMGARDWARLILREDAQATDHRQESWALGLQESRLSDFLAGQQAKDMDTVENRQLADQTFLSGQIEDAQAYLNLYNLSTASDATSPIYQSFEKLFTYLKLPEADLERLHQGLKTTWGGASSAAAEAPISALRPQVLDELPWFGLSPLTIETLRPYVVLIPAVTRLNINTTSPVCLYATVPSIGLAQAQAIIARGRQAPYSDLSQANDAWKPTPPATAWFVDKLHDVKSRYFFVAGQLRFGDLTFAETALVQRDSNSREVSTVWYRAGPNRFFPRQSIPLASNPS
jgi:general secretion pathway protein K